MNVRGAWQAWIVATVFSVPARAQPPTEISVVLRDCRSDTREVSPELIALVRIELRADGFARVIRAARSELGAVLWIRPACDLAQESSFEIGYDDPAVDRHLERSLSLADVSAALRERALALALAELVRAEEANRPVVTTEAATPASTDPATTVEAELQPSVAPAADGGGASAFLPSPARGASSRWSFALGPVLQILSRTTLLGAELAVGRYGWSAGALGDLANDSDQLGELDYRRLHGFVAYDVWSAEPAVFRIAAAVRAEFGATFTSVRPTKLAASRDVTAASGAIAFEPSVAWRFHASWQTKLCLHAGYAFGPRIQADDRNLADFSGVYFGASAALVLAL